MNEEHVVKHFSLSLPIGPDQDNVSDLLRYLAKELEKLDKKVEILDIVFHDEIDQDGKNWPSFTVYYG